MKRHSPRRPRSPARCFALLSFFLLLAASTRGELPDDFARDVWPATATNPRYSEGSLLPLRDGSLLYATTEFIGGGSDFSSARIVGRASKDGGRTWGEKRVLQENVGERNVMSVTLRRLPKRDTPAIGMFYLVKNGADDLDVCLRVSTDETRTFGEPVLVTDAPGYHVMNNDRVLVLRDGRLICPVASTGDVRQEDHFVSSSWLSDDGGTTWRRGEGRVDLPRRGAMEPEVIELRDGDLLMILRTQLGEIWAARSNDRGDTWSAPRSFGVESPEAPATLRRIPSTGDLLLVWNPEHVPGAGHGGPRTPLVAALSRDEGASWGPPITLEGRADRAYAYTSLAFHEERALLSYYVRDEETGRISSRFRSLAVERLVDRAGGNGSRASRAGPGGAADGARPAESSRDPRASEVDRLFARWNAPDRPGVAVGVVREGQAIYLRGFGSADLEHGIPITPRTVFDIASVSKQFCAFSVLLLASRDKVSLDDDIREHLPEVEDIGSPITVRELLHHTSGIRDWPQALAMAGWSMEDVISFEQILELARRQRSLNFPPGSEYTYSNTGYNLLARLVERISGTSYRTWTEENIFSPLGMASTHFHDDHREVVKNRADSYVPDGSGGYRKAVENLTALGSSSLYTTVEDLVLWVRNFDKPKVGTREILDRMDRPGRLAGGKGIDYAMGQVVGTYRGLRTVSHSGGWAGFRTHLVRFPEKRFAVIVLSNTAELDAGRAALDIAAVFLEEDLEEVPPGRKESESESGVAAEPVSAKLEECAGRYEVDSGIMVTMTLEGKKLVAEGPGFSGVGLLRQPDGAFTVPGMEGARILFETGDGSKVLGLRATLGGEEFRGKKLPELEPLENARLEEYAGTYYSRELQTSYEIAVAEEGLIARHQRVPEVRLRRVADDRFRGEHWALARLRFERGEDGAITGFRVTGGERVRDILFERGRWVPDAASE